MNADGRALDHATLTKLRKRGGRPQRWQASLSHLHQLRKLPDIVRGFPHAPTTRYTAT